MRYTTKEAPGVEELERQISLCACMDAYPCERCKAETTAIAALRQQHGAATAAGTQTGNVADKQSHSVGAEAGALLPSGMIAIDAERLKDLEACANTICTLDHVSDGETRMSLLAYATECAERGTTDLNEEDGCPNDP